MKPAKSIEPIASRQIFDAPEDDRARLLAVIERMIEPMLTAIQKRGEGLFALSLLFVLDRAPAVSECLKWAVPTTEIDRVLDLVRLRLESIELEAAVRELSLTATGCRIFSEQVASLVDRPKRDFQSADRALDRLRAEFGEDAIVFARLKDAHLPEARFTWELFQKTVSPQPEFVRTRPLIRRMFQKPVAISLPDPILRTIGPYFISGGWWSGAAVSREYYFALVRDDELLWIYHDRRRNRWFMQGLVE